MEIGTIEQALPGLEQVPAEPVMKPGHALPLTPQKRLMVFSGRSHHDLDSASSRRLGAREAAAAPANRDERDPRTGRG